MNTEVFMEGMLHSQTRDVEVLIKKGKEYTVDGDRLAQFDHAAALRETNSATELVNMATKHFTAIDMMSRDPDVYPMDLWKEKLTDLRNYMHLLEGLLIDMGIE